MPSSRTSILAKMFEKPSTRHQRGTNFSSVHSRQTFSTGALNVCVTARSSVSCGSFAIFLLPSVAFPRIILARGHRLPLEKRRELGGKRVGVDIVKLPRQGAV